MAISGQICKLFIIITDNHIDTIWGRNTVPKSNGCVFSKGVSTVITLPFTTNIVEDIVVKIISILNKEYHL